MVARPFTSLLRRKTGLVILAIGALAAIVTFLLIRPHTQSTASRPLPSQQAASGYVDPSVCAGCHADIAATYRKTGMGRSFSRPSKANTVEDYSHANTVDNKASGLHYTMVERDGRFFQQRDESGFDGKKTNLFEEQADYIIGSGNHARNYLHRNAQGELIELPVSWYTERSGYWAMSPGYDRKDQEDFRRAITPECMFCHNGYPQGEAAAIEKSGDRLVFPEKLPEGIDCQRCHGPGRAHVEAVSAGASLQAIQAAIVNPAKLNRDRQMEVCLQCHLETSSRHMPNELRAFDRDVFSYRPGEPLGDYKLYFDRSIPGKSADDTNDTFEIAHAAYRLRKSACFRNSQMTCLTCHDPHAIPRGQEATQHYTKVCQGCHEKVVHTVALPSGSTCMSCHMPKRRTEDAVHVVMTDHFIQRNRPLRDLLAPIAEQVEPADGAHQVTLYYPAKLPETPAAQLYMAAAVASDSAQGIPALEAAIARDSPKGPEAYLALGRAYARAGKNTEAIQWFDQALARQSNFRPAVQQLVLALFATGQEARAAEVLQRALVSTPNDDLLLANLGNAYLRQGKLSEAQEQLQRALVVNPVLPDAHNLMGLVALQQGDQAAAESSFREAIRCQPDLSEARSNLATLLTGRHEFPEAAHNFQRALAANPDYADAHHGYGLLLILTGAYSQAIAELETAARLAPGNAQIHSDLADVFAAQNRVSEAAAEYAQVLRLQPQQADAHFGLGLALLQQRDLAGARQHLQIAAQSSDPAIAGAAQQALQQIGR
jgi:predicted CXXCH cytochrome family protein